MKRKSARKRRDRRSNLSPYARKGKTPHKYENTPLPHAERSLNTASPKAIATFNERLRIIPWIGRRKPYHYPNPTPRVAIARKGRHLYVEPWSLSPEARHVRIR